MRYEKGHKDASRQRIIDVAAEKFRTDGIAATGLAGIMSAAGLTNGAFYPHFKSKAALVEESVAAALDGQSVQIADTLASGGVEAVIDLYLSAAHRDHPGQGCASAALLPELGREAAETRTVYTEHILTLADQLAAALPRQVTDRRNRATAIFALLIGTLQLARAATPGALSDSILAAGAEAARTLARAAG